MCTTCSRDSLRERARSERLRNLSERLKWVRGPGVRRSLILPLFPLFPQFRPLSHFHPHPLLPHQLNSIHFTLFPAQRTIHKARVLHPEDVARLPPVEALFQYRRCCIVRESAILVPPEVEPHKEDPLKSFFIAPSLISPTPAWPAYSPFLREGMFWL